MERDQQTVHYVTQDAMPSLKLRVTLMLLSAARTAPQANQVQLHLQAAAWSCIVGEGIHLFFSMLQAAPSSSSSSAGAAGADSPAAAVPDTSGRPEAFNVTRTFSWQEKVYSKAELVAAQVTCCLFLLVCVVNSPSTSLAACY